MLLARGEERLRAVAQELEAEYELCDVADRADVERVAASVGERHPAVDALVNSAGVPGRKSFLAAEPERIENVLRINYLGSVWSLQAFLPALEAAAPSHVVNVVSVAGTVAFPPSGPYSASKHAQLAFSRSVAAELAPRRIRVHTVNPGFVETEGFPQRAVLRSPVLKRAVVGPDVVADRIVKALRRGRREFFVPGWYRTAAFAQTLAPTLVARLLARGLYRPSA